MKVRITLWPNTDLDVDQREVNELRALGLLIEPAPEPAPLPLQADTPPTPPRPSRRRRGSAASEGANA